MIVTFSKMLLRKFQRNSNKIGQEISRMEIFLQVLQCMLTLRR